MGKRTSVAILSGALFVAAAGGAKSQEDVSAGARNYRPCAACHSLEPGVHLTGPSLAGLWGKKAASVADFARYPSALKASDLTWNEDTLNAWLAGPDKLVPGNYMVFRGIMDDKARGDLIAFLKEAWPRAERRLW